MGISTNELGWLLGVNSTATLVKGEKYRMIYGGQGGRGNGFKRVVIISRFEKKNKNASP